MTDERNPQDRARELAEKIFKLLEREDDDQVFSEDLFIDQAIPLIVAHTASQLAGAVPQEELRALWEKWRKSANKSRMALGKVNAEKQPEWSTELETNWHDLEMCADALESLIEKRR